MKTNKLSLRLIKYEIVNTSSNIFTIIFGIAFPLLMSMLFSFIFSSDLSEDIIPHLNASLYRKMIMIVPLATMFIGHASNFSQEVESGSHQRFMLFGYKESTLLAAKLVANLVFLTGALIVYSVLMFLILDIAAPTFTAFAVLIVFVYLFAAALLVLSHAIAALLKRFGATFGVTMALYFGFMILGGMMGVDAAEFPGFLNAIAKALPLYYMDTGFGEFWTGGSFDFLPLVISLAGLFVFSSGLFVLAVVLNKKGKKRDAKARAVYWD